MSIPFRIENFSIRGFRNFSELEVKPGPRFNVIHGENGSGKSNFLEAISYVACLRSFRNAKPEDLIQDGAARALLRARVAGGVLPSTFEIALNREEARRATIDGKKLRSTAQWMTRIQSVLFHPGDLDLTTGVPEKRRSFLDRILEQLDPTFSAALAAYQRALRSRNRLLKASVRNVASIRAFDPILAQTGEIIGHTRSALVKDLTGVATQSFEKIGGSDFVLGLSYRSKTNPTAAHLTDALATSFEKDLIRGSTTVGPHTDDLELTFRGAAAKHHASQGQHRAIVLALKLAELEVLLQKTGKTPLLLMDDVSSELDRIRNERLFSCVRELGAQVFLTTTHADYIRLMEDRVDFRVEQGRFYPAST